MPLPGRPRGARAGTCALWLAAATRLVGEGPPGVPVPLPSSAAPADVRVALPLPATPADVRILGMADPGAALDRMILVLRPGPGREDALGRFLDEVQDPGSPRYHRWLAPAAFGARFGAAPEVLERVTGWLRDQGLTVEPVPRGRLAVVFSGTAAQVQRAFGTVLVAGFGACEAELGPAGVAFYRYLWDQAAAQGTTVVAAAGDQGAAGCGPRPGAAVSGVASTRSNVAVGGTRFADGTGRLWRWWSGRGGASATGYIPEWAWNQTGTAWTWLGGAATGGGPSRCHSKPAWQAAPQYGAGGAAVFHDVLAGNNTVPGTSGHPCGPGYDMATGLGSVDADALLAAWPAPREARPARVSRSETSAAPDAADAPE